MQKNWNVDLKRKLTQKSPWTWAIWMWLTNMVICLAAKRSKQTTRLCRNHWDTPAKMQLMSELPRLNTVCVNLFKEFKTTRANVQEVRNWAGGVERVFHVWQSGLLVWHTGYGESTRSWRLVVWSLLTVLDVNTIPPSTEKWLREILHDNNGYGIRAMRTKWMRTTASQLKLERRVHQQADHKGRHQRRRWLQRTRGEHALSLHALRIYSTVVIVSHFTFHAQVLSVFITPICMDIHGALSFDSLLPFLLPLPPVCVRLFSSTSRCSLSSSTRSAWLTKCAEWRISPAVWRWMSLLLWQPVTVSWCRSTPGDKPNYVCMCGVAWSTPTELWVLPERCPGWNADTLETSLLAALASCNRAANWRRLESSDDCVRGQYGRFFVPFNGDVQCTTEICMSAILWQTSQPSMCCMAQAIPDERSGLSILSVVSWTSESSPHRTQSSCPTRTSQYALVSVSNYEKQKTWNHCGSW